MRNPLVQSDLTLVQPNSSYLTKHVCFETWSLTLPSLFWWNLMKNKSQLFRHLNIPFKSIFREEFNGTFRFSIHSAKLELFHKTYIVLFLFLLYIFSRHDNQPWGKSKHVKCRDFVTIWMELLHARHLVLHWTTTIDVFFTKLWV